MSRRGIAFVVLRMDFEPTAVVDKETNLALARIDYPEFGDAEFTIQREFVATSRRE